MEMVWLVLIGFAAGTLGSMLGLGGGFLVVPALMLLRAMEPRIATGTAVAVIVPTMLITLWRRGAQGHIEWGVAGTIAIGAVIGAFLGSWLAGVVPGPVIRRVFACVLVGLAALLFFKQDPAPASDADALAPLGLDQGTDAGH
jgi:uncharacterized membrane protein YfcA